jgi:AbrB family looped-hinge helix DNA binding protein
MHMDVAITKMSENGQVVIPAGVRKDAGVGPSTKFLVFNHGGNILLKQMRKDSLAKDIELIESINNSEDQIRKGKVIKANTKMADGEIDDLLMG